MAAEFNDLIKRVYAGNSSAAAQLVRDYEPEIRRIIRFKLRDPRLRRVIDSTDICQSVFAKFFFRASLGQFQLDSPEALIRLLSKMATNRVIDRYRSEQSQHKLAESRTRQLEFSDDGQQIDLGHLPENVAEYEELLLKVRQRLTADELRISKMRASGSSWLEVSQELGASPQSLRKKLERACSRVFSEMGITDV